MALYRSEAPADDVVQDGDAEQFREYVLDPEDVARILNRNPHDVAGLARKGKLRAGRTGTRWKFRPQDVIVCLADLSQIDKSI